MRPEDQGRFPSGHLLFIMFFFFFSVIMLNYFIQVIRAGLSEALLVAHTALLELCLIEFDNKKQNFTLLSYVVEQN